MRKADRRSKRAPDQDAGATQMPNVTLPLRGTITTPDGARIDYARFGKGTIPVVLVPGAGDGLRTAAEAAWQLQWFYRERRYRYRMLVLSRRDPVFPQGRGIDGHARDMAWAVSKLRWGASIWECNSAGGPIGQRIAAESPELVRGLVLACSLHRTAPETRAVLEDWIRMIDEGEWGDFIWSTFQHTYRPTVASRWRLAKPLMSLAAPPKRAPRVRRLLEELLDLDQSDVLPEISCPALVAGGEDDLVVPAKVQREMAELIPGARLELHAGYGHGDDVENPVYRRAFDRFVVERGLNQGA